MKKYFLILVVGIMSGCASNQTFIKRSEVAIVSDDNKKLYICDKNQGPMIYRQWLTGVYGDSTKVLLVDTATFNKMCKKSIPYNISRGNGVTYINQ